MLRQLKTT